MRQKDVQYLQYLHHDQQDKLASDLQKLAEDKNIFCKHIEVEERNDFISQIATCSQAFLRKISTKEKFRNLIEKPLDAIKSLVVSFDPNDNTFSLSMQEKELYKITNLTQSLTDVFTSLGEAAYKSETCNFWAGISMAFLDCSASSDPISL